MERPKADAKRIAKNTVVLYFRMMAVMAVGLFTSRVQLQALGVENFGLFQVAMATLTLFCFVSGSFGMASSRFLTVEMGKGSVGSLKRVFSTVLQVHFVLAAIVVLLLETIGLYVLNTKLNVDPSRLFAVKWAYHCGVFTTFLGITQVPYSAVIVAHERMSAFAFMSFYDVAAKLLIVYLLFVSPVDRLVTYATLWALSSVTTIAIYRLYCIRNFTEARFRRVFNRDLLKPIFSFMGWQFLSQIVFMLVMETVVMLNQRYFGPTVVAALALANSVNGHVQSFVNNFRSAANPQLMKLYAAREFEQTKALLTDTIHVSEYLLLVLGVPLWFYAPEALAIWLGNNVPPHAVAFLRIVLANSFFMIFDYSFFTIINADGRMKYNTIADVVVYGPTFAIIWYAMARWGNPLTSALGQGVMSCVLATLVKPFLLHCMAGYCVRDYLKMYVPPLVALGLCAGVTWPLRAIAPAGPWWAVPVCAVAAFCNGFVVFSLVASQKIQRQLPSALRKSGFAGRQLAPRVESYLAFVNRMRAKVFPGGIS